MAKTNMKALAMLAGVVILAHATASEQCDNPADPLQFHYSCVSQDVNLCIPGRRLKVTQPECNGQVDMDEICVPCDRGTYMPVNNFCNECIRKTECGPGQIENPEVKPNALRDRECIDRPATAAPPVAPSPCPPCEPPTQPICPACPECPTTDAPNTAGNVGGEWPSYIPDSVSSTQPQGGTSTVVGPFSIHEPEEKDNTWMISSIVLMIVNLIQPFFWWYIWRRSKLCQEVHPKREVKADFNGCVIKLDGFNEKMANGQKKNDSDDRAAQKGNGPSGRISNPEGGPSAKECTASNPTGASKDRAAPLQNSSDETPGNNSAPSHSSQKATPPPRQGCSWKGDWPSTQPLLDSSMRKGNTLASGVPTDIHQPNELASSVPDRAGERSLQSKQLRIPELHEAPSAQDWRPSPSDFTSETVHDSRGTPPNEATPLQSNGDAELPSKAPYNHPAPSMSGQQAAPLPRWGYNVKGDSPSAQPLLASMAQQGNTLPTDVYQQSVAASGVPERAGESQLGMLDVNVGTPPNEATPLQSNGDAELPSKAPYNHPAPSMSGQQAAPLPGWGYNVKGDSPSAQPLLASMAQQGNTLPTDVYQQSVAASGVPERAGESQLGMLDVNVGTPPNEVTPLQSNGDAELPSKAPYNHPAPSKSGQQAAPLPRWGYNVKGDSPSAQPLLASMAQQGNTLPTDVYQQSVAASGVPERAGESQFGMQSLQSNQASSAALHEAPTAPYRERKPPPSYSAYEKADGPSGKTTRFNEWHADFVKDNIDVNTHKDFFVKLGLSKKDYDATMYDNRHSGIREQIRHVLTDVFIQKQGSNHSLYKVICALKASGNGLVADEFIEEFGVTSS